MERNLETERLAMELRELQGAVAAHNGGKTRSGNLSRQRPSSAGTAGGGCKSCAANRAGRRRPAASETALQPPAAAGASSASMSATPDSADAAVAAKEARQDAAMKLSEWWVAGCPYTH